MSLNLHLSIDSALDVFIELSLTLKLQTYVKCCPDMQ